MTILKKLIAILGLFWATICGTSLPSVLCHAISGHLAAIHKHRQSVIERSCCAFAAPDVYRKATLPMHIIISSIRKAALPVTSVSAALLAVAICNNSTSDWWVAQLTAAPKLFIGVLQNKTSLPDVVLVAGIDFYVLGNLIYLNRDPGLLHLSLSYMSISDMSVLPVLDIVGVVIDALATYNMFEYITSTRRDQYGLRTALWRTRVDGLTEANMQSICALLLGIPVATESALVLAVLLLYGNWYIYTGAKCYSSALRPRVAVGDVVRRGLALCTGFAIYTCRTYKQCKNILLLLVATPVGRLTAVNAGTRCTDPGILPLQSTDNCTYADYSRYIKSTYPSYAASGVPALVNPVSFIINNHYSSSFILIALDKLPAASKLQALYDRLLQLCPADSIIYILDLTTGKARLLYSIILEI